MRTNDKRRPCSVTTWKTSTPTTFLHTTKPSRGPKPIVWPSDWNNYTPKHGSWLNIAEIELSALSGQCLCRRIPDIATMRRETLAWQQHLNNRGASFHWRFTTEDARIKLA